MHNMYNISYLLRGYTIVLAFFKKVSKVAFLMLALVVYGRVYGHLAIIFYYFFLWLRNLQLFAYTHAKFEELNILLTGQARCLNGYLNLLLHSMNVVKWFCYTTSHYSCGPQRCCQLRTNLSTSCNLSIKILN